jgi:uncharacterized repeat protein (TIGR01451 family)
MGRLLVIIVLAAAFLALAGPFGRQEAPGPMRDAPMLQGHAEGEELLQRLRSGIYFEPNLGQAAPEVAFLARGAAHALLFERDRVLLRLAEPAALPDWREGLARGDLPDLPDLTSHTVEMRFGGASPAPLEGQDPTSLTVNYYDGPDPANWVVAVPTYSSLRYQGIYPGIDAVFYDGGGALEYDLVVHPGADPESVQLSFHGHDGLRVDALGDLVITVAGRDLRMRAPVVYQDSPSGRESVASGYRVAGDGTVSFEVGRYDRALALVIDPVIEYASYFGGNGIDAALGVDVDPEGNIWVAGITTSTDLEGARGGTDDGFDGFVASFTPDGQPDTLTIVSGTGDVIFEDIVFSPNPATARGPFAGGAFVAGWTTASDVPIPGEPPQPESGGVTDGLIAHVGADGTLDEATYLGGPGHDYAFALDADAVNLWVTGSTGSGADFPEVNPIQAEGLGGFDAFLVRAAIAEPTDRLFFFREASRFGGTNTDVAYDLDLAQSLDNQGYPLAAAAVAMFGGTTTSEDFLRFTGTQQAPGGGQDGWLMYFDGSDVGLSQGTYVGGMGVDSVNAVTVVYDGLGRAIAAAFAGSTTSTDLPVSANALQATYSGGTVPDPEPHAAYDAMVGADCNLPEFSGAQRGGLGLLFCYLSYWGVSSVDDAALDMDTAPSGVGVWISFLQLAEALGIKDLVIEGLLMACFGDEFDEDDAARGQPVALCDVRKEEEFVLPAVDGHGASPNALDVRADDGTLFVAGETNSDEFPVSDDAAQQDLMGTSDVFIAALVTQANADLSVTKTPSDISVDPGQDLSYTVVVTNNGPGVAPLPILTDFLPFGFVLDGIQAGGGTCRYEPQPFGTRGFEQGHYTVCFGPVLAPGETWTVTLLGHVSDAVEPGQQLENIARTGLPLFPGLNPENDEAVAQVTVADQPVADLVLMAEQVGFDTQDPSVIDIRFTVTNDGPDNSTGSDMTIDEGFGDVIGSLASQGTFADRVWSVGPLAVGESATLDLQIAHTGATGIRGFINRTNELDPDLANNEAILEYAFMPLADISVELPGGALAPGNEVRWLIVVRNLGPDDATNVMAFPQAFADFTTAEPSQGTFADGVWTIGALPVGGRVTMSVTAPIDGPGSYTLFVEAEAAEEDPNPANNSLNNEVVITTLFEGYNPTDYEGADVLPDDGDGARAHAQAVIDAMNNAVEPDAWDSVSHYVAAQDTWLTTFRDAPLDSFNTLDSLLNGNEYWIFVTEEVLFGVTVE